MHISNLFREWKFCICTLVPEAFLYSLLANFVTRTSSVNCFYWHEVGASISASRRKFPNKKDSIKGSLWDQGIAFGNSIAKQASLLAVPCLI